MSLLGELLFAQLVENVEFLSQDVNANVTDGRKLDLNNDLTIGNHHRHTSEEDL
jgi:hypothetical protein